MRVTYLFDCFAAGCYGAGPALERLGQLDDVTLEADADGSVRGEGRAPDGCAVSRPTPGRTMSD